MDAQTLISNKNITSEIEKGVLFAFAETHMNEMGHRFHRLVGESNDSLSEVSVLKKQVSDLTIRLENTKVQLSTVSEERDQMKEKVEKMGIEAQKLVEEKLEKEIMIVELKKERDLAVKNSKELEKVISDLKEKIDAVKILRETNCNSSKMLANDSTICTVDWSNLPHVLLSKIANSIGPFGYLSFCLVCKDWRNATLGASREDIFSRCDPCFLLYGKESSQCTLLSNTDKIYTIDIPELDGATCLASYDGWLLVFRDGSLFFFCPFSKAKLELPSCPFTQLTNHIAAFSSSPTSQDCIVVVVNYTTFQLHVHMLCRGDNIWVNQSVSFHSCSYFSSTRVAYFLEGEFMFMDEHGSSASFDCVNSKQWMAFSFPKKRKNIFYHTTISDVRRKLGLNVNLSLSTCGTLHLRANDEFPIVVFMSEYIGSDYFQRSHLKGVWVVPRYHHIHADQSW